MRYGGDSFILLASATFSLLTAPVLGNVEKAIFLGPDTVRVPAQHPTLEDLQLDSLTPLNWTLRTALAAEFPNSTYSAGKATWLLLDDLVQGQRYEVRICWAATQPTSFTLNTYTLDTVFSTPSLMASLNDYTLARLQQQPSSPPPPSLPSKQQQKEDRFSSLLLLEILAAADFFTTNATLMNRPPPVDVDLILDPFLLNVLPRSLLPTVLYIAAVAAVAWFFVSGRVLSFFEGIISSSPAVSAPGSSAAGPEGKKKN